MSVVDINFVAWNRCQSFADHYNSMFIWVTFHLYIQQRIYAYESRPSAALTFSCAVNISSHLPYSAEINLLHRFTLDFPLTCYWHTIFGGAYFVSNNQYGRLGRNSPSRTPTCQTIVHVTRINVLVGVEVLVSVFRIWNCLSRVVSNELFPKMIRSFLFMGVKILGMLPIINVLKAVIYKPNGSFCELYATVRYPVDERASSHVRDGCNSVNVLTGR